MLQPAVCDAAITWVLSLFQTLPSDTTLLLSCARATRSSQVTLGGLDDDDDDDDNEMKRHVDGRFAANTTQSGVGRRQIRVCCREQPRSRLLVRCQSLRPR